MENLRRQQPTNGIFIAPQYQPVPVHQQTGQRPSIEQNIDRPSKRDKGMKELLKQLVEEKETGELRQDSKRNKREFRWPAKWRSAGKKSQRKDHVLVFYLNIKGELEQPKILPIYGGHMIVWKDKVHEVDPRSLWTVKMGPNKFYKVLIVKEIDRRPVSNLDWDEIRARGDATDSDEYLIKAALKAQIMGAKKTISRGAMILIGLGAVALLILLFTMG